jgi:hypothetical protein
LLTFKDFTKSVMGLQSIMSSGGVRLTELKDTWVLLNITRGLKATNPRDKVYGLLGIIDLGVTPKYEKSVKDVYVETAVAKMDESFEVVLLMSGNSSEMPTQDQHGVPSWVPDLTQQASQMFPFNHSFSASKSDGLSPRPTVTGDCLRTLGIFCDEVESLESPVTCPEVLNVCYRYIESQKQIGRTHYPSGIPHLQALIQILLFNWEKMIESRLDPGSLQFQNIACALLCHIVKEEISHRQRHGRPQFQSPLSALGLVSYDPEPTITFKENIIGETVSCECICTGHIDNQIPVIYESGRTLHWDIDTEIIRTYTSRKLFRTKAGYLGAARTVLPGDLVCILFGCNFPVLLRPKENYCVYVGPCYVVGLMNGEAMAYLKAGRLQQQEFEIR